LNGQVGDIFGLDRFSEFDIVLLDSMLHFAKKDKAKEIGLNQKIVAEIKIGSLLVICIQDTGNKVEILNQAIDFKEKLKRLSVKKFRYEFEDSDSGHKSKTDYRMIVIKK